MGHAIESLLEVKEREMEGLLLLAVLLDEETGGVDRVDGAALLDKAALVQRQLDGVSYPAIDNSLKDLHRVA